MVAGERAGQLLLRAGHRQPGPGHPRSRTPLQGTSLLLIDERVVQNLGFTVLCDVPDFGLDWLDTVCRTECEIRSHRLRLKWLTTNVSRDNQPKQA